MVPAIKQITIKTDYGYNANIIVNPNFENIENGNLEGWEVVGSVIPKQRVFDTDGNKYVYLPGTEHYSDWTDPRTNSIRTTPIPVKATTNIPVISLSAAVLGTLGGAANLFFGIKLVATDGTQYSVVTQLDVDRKTILYNWSERTTVQPLPLPGKVTHVKVLLGADSYFVDTELAESYPIDEITQHFSNQAISLKEGIPEAGNLYIYLYLPNSSSSGIYGSCFREISLKFTDANEEDLATGTELILINNLRNNYTPDDLEIINGTVPAIENNLIIYSGSFILPDGSACNNFKLDTNAAAYSWGELMGRLLADQLRYAKQSVKARLIDIPPSMRMVFVDPDNPIHTFLESGISFDFVMRTIEGQFIEIKTALPTGFTLAEKVNYTSNTPTSGGKGGTYYATDEKVGMITPLYEIVNQPGYLSTDFFEQEISEISGRAIIKARNVTDMSITGNGTPETPFILVNDEDEPGPSQYYGTDAAENKGWHDLQAMIDNSVPFLKTGWISNAWTMVTISATDREITLTPVATSFNYWILGVNYTKTAAETIEIPDVTGLYFVYYNAATLEASLTPWSISDDNRAFVCLFYWNATQQKAILKGWEFHTFGMGPAEHNLIHTTIGTRYAGGLAVAANGTNAWKIDVTEGTIIDEDINCFITDPLTADIFSQTLAALEAPKLYRTGAGVWNEETAVPSNIVSLNGSNEVYVNTVSAGTWSLVATTVNKYSAMWLIAFTDFETPLKWVMGQEPGDNLAGALATNTLTDLNISGLPGPEFRIIARVIVKNTNASPWYEIALIDQMQNDDIIVGGDVTNDNYVTGASWSAGAETLTITRNNSLPAITVNIPIPSEYNLPPASSTTLGGVKIGDTLEIDESYILNVKEAFTKDWIEFEFRDIVAGTAADYVLDLKALVAYNIDSAVLQVDAGTLTVAVKINTTAVTSISAVAADTDIDETTATGANSVATGDKVILAVSTTYTGAPTLIRGKLNLTRT